MLELPGSRAERRSQIAAGRFAMQKVIAARMQRQLDVGPRHLIGDHRLH